MQLSAWRRGFSINLSSHLLLLRQILQAADSILVDKNSSWTQYIVHNLLKALLLLRCKYCASSQKRNGSFVSVVHNCPFLSLWMFTQT